MDDTSKPKLSEAISYLSLIFKAVNNIADDISKYQDLDFTEEVRKNATTLITQCDVVLAKITIAKKRIRLIDPLYNGLFSSKNYAFRTHRDQWTSFTLSIIQSDLDELCLEFEKMVDNAITNSQTIELVQDAVIELSDEVEYAQSLFNILSDELDEMEDEESF
jgi:hypothetical protein